MPMRIGSDPAAAEMVSRALAKVAPSARSAAEALFKAAAGADGNRWLNRSEAKMVADAFEAAASASGGQIGSAELAELKKSVNSGIDRELRAANVDGLTAHFSDDTNLEEMVLSGLRDVVKKANGRPVDVNCMLFQFQSRPIADEILAITRDNPNVTVRLIADFSQTAKSAQNQMPYLEEKAAPKRGKKGIPNLEIQYKKDAPYTYNAKLKRPMFSHSSTSGLNHHKGFVALIDGQPERAMLGSFNWSKTAATSNYEDLIDVDASKGGDAKKLAESWQKEFVAFYNHPDSLTAEQARELKKDIWSQFRESAGRKPLKMPDIKGEGGYTPPAGKRAVDVNSLSSANVELLSDTLGKPLGAKVVKELKANGRFGSFDELLKRVPELAALPPAGKAKLAAFNLGDGKVLVNVAAADELQRAGLTAAESKKIVSQRDTRGDFQSLEDLAARTGIKASRLTSLSHLLSARDTDAYFNAKPVGGESRTGYADDHANGKIALAGADGANTVSLEDATVTNAVVDLFRRAKPGDTVRVAIYGISASSREYQELLAANKRGVKVRLLINDGYNQAAVSALKNAGANTPGGPEVRLQTKKTMHTKFGVVNDDVFTGSANFSTTSSSKNSEERFLFRNNRELAEDYTGKFEDIWNKSKVI